MERRRSGSLAVQLEDAEQTLRQSLAEVCAKRPSARTNTGELIRVAAMLEIAGSAVKRAIAIRRRRRVDEALRTHQGAMADAESMMTRTTARHPFTDSMSITWDVFDVYPTGDAVALSRLESSFHHGWLCFQSAGEKRRLSPIPWGWQSLSDEELERLLRRAEIVPVPRRRRRSRDDLTPPSA